jgi:hypothetical protein
LQLPDPVTARSVPLLCFAHAWMVFDVGASTVA